MAEIIKMNDNTWRIENDFVRFFLLEGSEKSVLLDSGYNCADAKKMAEELTDKPLILVNTHGDGDHISGTGAFEEVWMHETDYEGCGAKERFPNTVLHGISDGEKIDLGNRTLELIFIPGHTAGSIAVLDVENRVLYSGDSVQDGHIFMFGGHRKPEAFEGSLEKLIAMKNRFDSVFASHGTPVLTGEFVEKVLKDWQEVQAGKVTGVETELHGMTVKSYDGEFCGFYLF